MSTVNSLNRGTPLSWNRSFYAVEIDNNRLIIKECTLNIFQRVLRTLFRAYSSTLWTQQKIDHLREQFPSEISKINDLVARLILCKKNLSSPLNNLPDELKLNIFNRLDGASLIACERVCKEFNTFINLYSSLWKNNFAYEHNNYTPPEDPVIGWRAFYLQQGRVAKSIATHSFPKPITIKPYFDGPSYATKFTYGNELYLIEPSGSTELYCYDLTAGNQIAKFTHLPAAAFTEEGLESIAIVNTHRGLRPINSTHFLSVGASQLSVWDASKRSCIFATNNVKDELVHAQGSHLIYYTTEGCLEVWDFTTKRRAAQIKDPSLHDIGVYRDNERLPDDKYKIVGNIFFILMKNGTVHAYDIAKGEKAFTLTPGNSRPFTKLLATKNHLVALKEQIPGLIGARAPTEEDNQAYVYTPLTGSLLHTIRLHPAGHPAYHANQYAEIAQNQLIGIPRDAAGDAIGTVACWDLDTGTIVKRFTPPAGAVYFFAVGCSDRLVITTTRQAVDNIGITIWDLNDQTLLSETYYKGFSDGYEVGTTVKIHNHIMYFGRCPFDQLHFWDLATAKPIGTFPFENSHADHGYTSFWHFDGTRFFMNPGSKIAIYNLDQLKI